MQDPNATFVESPYLVPFDGQFRIERAQTELPKEAPKKPERVVRLASAVERLADMQTALYAEDKHAILLVFQAMDAAGKDGTIKAVTEGLNPAGCMVQSFKQPSQEALDHDFLWRISSRLPERGRIGIFNRSHYEEVLVVRVHPELLKSQRLPNGEPKPGMWEARYQSIRDFERHIAKNGTVVVKFFLHVSKEEQRQRFLERIVDPEKNWKFSAHDVRERGHWDDYMQAYEDALNATSRPWAPWYAIPADCKSYMRMVVAEIVQHTVEQLNLRFPKLDPKEEAEMHQLGRLLELERD
jgi:PPK2 family polyphosphate:nucleotide phosphotransferase